MSNDQQVRDRLTGLLAKRRNYQQEIRKLTAQYEYVVFYGCGSMFHSVIDTWNTYICRKIDYCCDSDSVKWGNLFDGIKCISPQDLLAIKDRCAVFVTMDEFKQVFCSLKKSGFPSVNTLYLFDIMASDLLANHDHSVLAANLSKTYGFLSDKQSIRVFEAIINRVLGSGENADIMSNVCEKNQYFPSDVFKLSDHESFVDIGAFDGDTVRDFIYRTRAKFDHIFSFEMNEINFKLLKDNVKQMPNHDRIKVFNLGAWDNECDITYNIGDSSSRIGGGECKGHVVPIDTVLRNEKVTFIKMDIEGAEPNALIGAQQIIREQKPTLAICIYHDLKHLWEIPILMKKLVPEYNIYLRHYTNIERETVCYATYKGHQLTP